MNKDPVGETVGCSLSRGDQRRVWTEVEAVVAEATVENILLRSVLHRSGD